MKPDGCDGPERKRFPDWSFDWPWEQGEIIRACPHCTSWRAELLIEPDDVMWVREWHAIECPVWAEVHDIEA